MANAASSECQSVMSEIEQNKQLIRDHYTASWNGDETLIRQQVDSDFVDHGAPESPVGIEPLIAYARGIRSSFPDMRVTIRNIVAEGDRVAVHAVWQGTHRGLFRGIAATNRVVTLEGMVFWRVAKGKDRRALGSPGYGGNNAAVAGMTSRSQDNELSNIKRGPGQP